MRTYETVFILQPNLSAEDYEKHINFYKDNIVSNGGEIVKTEVWGKQTLAYPIRNNTEGYYVLIQFKAQANYTNDELSKRFQFNEDILRYVVVMLDEKRFKQNPRKEPVRKERPAEAKGERSENEESTMDSETDKSEETADSEEK